jgi:mannosyltransferase
MPLSNIAVKEPGLDAHSTPPIESVWTAAPAWIVALLLAAASLLRFLFLSRKPFWFDECFSVEIARLSWHDFVRLLWWREANMSLYYLLLRGWLYFGGSLFLIRGLSVLFSLATLPAIFWLACKLFDRRAGVIAVALMSCNAYSIRYAQEARSYSLFLLLSTLSSVFFIGGLRERSRRNWWGYVVSSVLAVYAHLFAVLLIAAQWLSLELLTGRQDLQGRTSVFSSSAFSSLRRAWIWIGVAVLPLLVFVGKTGAGPIRWIWRPGFLDVLDFFEHLAGNRGVPLLLLYLAACAAAILPVWGRLLRLAAEWNIWRVQFLLTWLLFPVGLTLLISIARPIFLGRYFIFCLPALVILAAAGLASLRKAWMMGLCLAIMIALSLQGTFAYYDHDFDVERDGSGAGATYIYGRAQPGDAILFYIAEARFPYEFFGSLRAHDERGTGPQIVFPRHGDRLDYRDVTGKPSSELLRSLPEHYARVWVVLMDNGAPGEPSATTLMLTRTLGELFPRVETALFPRVEVRLYSGR